jgi:hypothetical protein
MVHFRQHTLCKFGGVPVMRNMTTCATPVPEHQQQTTHTAPKRYSDSLQVHVLLLPRMNRKQYTLKGPCGRTAPETKQHASTQQQHSHTFSTSCSCPCSPLQGCICRVVHATNFHVRRCSRNSSNARDCEGGIHTSTASAGITGGR